jgi:ATP-dependent RNA helicase RhlE
VSSFSDLGLSEKALAAVKRMGYTAPTPVQERAIPVVLEGRDVIAAAKTGTGKTGAFALPSMDKLGHVKGSNGPLLLVITPTRELAQQIFDVCEQIAQSTHHRITCVVGGLSYRPQIERLKHGTDVLIATPGRLIDLMDQKAVHLGEVTTLVLDEADRMLDMGFLPSVKKIVAATPRDRQTLLFSATIDSSIEKVTGSLLNDPVTVEIAHKGEVADTIDQFLIRTPQGVKPALLKEVLKEKGADRVIVFCRTRSRADSTCRRLRRAGYNVEAIHSNRSQNQRRRALDKFEAGEVNIITATDVLARGIDVDEVDYVVNYDLPEQPEDYVHRIGRTGRAGQRGFAISFVTPENRDALRDIERMTKQTIPEMELNDFDWDAERATAERKAANAQARHDPEIAQAKREMKKREKRREARRAAAAEAKPTRSEKRNRKNAPAATAPKTSSKRRSGGQGASSVQRTSDVRPGRAHRAAVDRARSKSASKGTSRNRRGNGGRGGQNRRGGNRA